MTLDPGDPIWDEHRSPAQIWRDDWDAHDRASTLPHRGFVLTHAESGLSRAEIRSLVRRRIWSAPRRGVLAVVPAGGDPRVEAALAASAAALTRRDSVISCDSAAILHGLPVLHVPTVADLNFTDGRTGPTPSLRIHHAPLSEAATSSWYGAPLTDPARTAIDIARRDRDGGLVVADAALREGLTSVEALCAVVTTCAGWPGNAAGRWVAQRADGLSESPLESLVRACLLVGGLPAPHLQVWIPEARARVDMLYPDRRVVIEADGMLKYNQPAALREEKRRQERLLQAGYIVVRVTWREVMNDPAGTLERVRFALRDARLIAGRAQRP